MDNLDLIQINCLDEIQQYLINVVQSTQQSLNLAIKQQQQPKQVKNQLLNEINKVKLNYSSQKNELINLYQFQRTVFKNSQNKTQDHKQQILENIMKYMDEANVYMTQEINDYICIGILWKTKIISNIFLKRQNVEKQQIDKVTEEQEACYQIYQVSMCQLNECCRESSRYKTDFEYETMRHMRFERLRQSNNVKNSNKNTNIINLKKGKDELWKDIQYSQVAEIIKIPVLQSRFSIFQVISELLREEFQKPNFNVTMYIKQHLLYSKVFVQEKQFTCNYCKQYMAYDHHFHNIIPPLLFTLKVQEQKQTVLFYHTQCKHKESQI